MLDPMQSLLRTFITMVLKKAKNSLPEVTEKSNETVPLIGCLFEKDGVQKNSIYIIGAGGTCLFTYVTSSCLSVFPLKLLSTV